MYDLILLRHKIPYKIKPSFFQVVVRRQKNWVFAFANTQSMNTNKTPLYL